MRKNMNVEIVVKASGQICDSCYDYVTNVRSDIKITGEFGQNFQTTIYYDDHYGQINWWGLYKPALDYLGIKIASEKEECNEEVVIRIFDSEYNTFLRLEINKEEKLFIQIDIDYEDLYSAMKKVFAIIIPNAKLSYDFEHISSSEEDDDWDD